MALYGVPPAPDPVLWKPRLIGSVSGTSKTPSLPSVPPVGGVIVAVIASIDATGGTPTVTGAGATWTLQQRCSSNTGSQFDLAVYFGIVGDTPSTGLTYTWTSTGGAIATCYQADGLSPVATMTSAQVKHENTFGYGVAITRTAARNNGIAAFGYAFRSTNNHNTGAAGGWSTISVSNNVGIVAGVFTLEALRANAWYGVTCSAADRHGLVMALLN